ncbi:hypothetical protein PQX77_010158 [Marasmius sp. AFHP31]|nr:hypothetical protein PQX77_010158 [Marasmius sp. AFHP31]
MDTQSWTSIRPWIPPLTLSVREITSVSVTFILSASSGPLAGEPDIAALLEDIQHRGEDEVDGDEEDNSTSNSESEAKKPSSPPSVVSRALAGGLSVEVDHGSWRRVLIRIDDKADEAVIIVYGLMPGKQYDVDLELVQGQTMRSQVVTQGTTIQKNCATGPHSFWIGGDSSPSNGTAAEAEAATTPTGPMDESAPTRPSTPPPNASASSQASSSQSQHSQPSGTSFSFAPLTLEDRISQLQQTLSLLNSETATLTASLKSAKRDSQKADAALRSEIEVLRRASERHNAGELRAKQKVLALQEAVKRANSSVTETKAEIQQVEEANPELEAERDQKEKEYQRILAQADKMRAEREHEEEVVRKRIDGYKSELNTLNKAQEKLETKQEKAENGVLKELQEKLDMAEQELQEMEMEESMAYALAQAAARPLGPMGLGLGPIGQQSRPYNILEPPSAVISRPLAGPIATPRAPQKSSSIPSTNTKVHVHNHSLPHHAQNYSHQNTHSNSPVAASRNQRSSSISTNHVSHHSHPVGPHSHGPHGPHHLGGRHSHGHHDRHTTAVPTTILTNPNRQPARGGSMGGPNSVPAAADSSSEGSSGSPSHGHMNAVKASPGTSTLSSRAPPFEPSKGFGTGMGLLRGSKPQ